MLLSSGHAALLRIRWTPAEQLLKNNELPSARIFSVHFTRDSEQRVCHRRTTQTIKRSKIFKPHWSLSVSFIHVSSSKLLDVDVFRKDERKRNVWSAKTQRLCKNAQQHFIFQPHHPTTPTLLCDKKNEEWLPISVCGGLMNHYFLSIITKVGQVSAPLKVLSDTPGGSRAAEPHFTRDKLQQ